MIHAFKMLLALSSHLVGWGIYKIISYAKCFKSMLLKIQKSNKSVINNQEIIFYGHHH